MDRLQQIQVPLPQELYPTTNTSEKSADKSEKEGRTDSKSDTEQVNESDDIGSNHDDYINRNDDLDSDKLEDILESNSESVTDDLNSEKDKPGDAKALLTQKEEISDSIQDSDVSGSTSKQDQGDSTGNVTKECEDRIKDSDKNEDVEQGDNSDSEGDNKRNSLIQEVCDIGEDGRENIELGEYMTNRDLEDVTCDVLRDLEVAMEKGEKVQRQLKKTTETEFINQMSKDYDKYTEEDMDDLLDEIMEEDENNDSESDLNQSDLKDEEAISDTNQSDKSLHISQSKELKSAKNMKKSEKSDQSETKKNVTSKPKAPGSLVLNNNVAELKTEAYNRHLKGISSDIHNYLDKLMTLFTVSYEQLDTPEGRDQLCESLEEPFFKPLWPYLLGLFR